MSMENSRELNASRKTPVSIVCKNVNKFFESKSGINQVVKDFNLTVRENEFVVLFGPGQCGKTTILNMISGMEPVTDGEITVNGEVVKGPSPKRGMVYQTTALFPWFSVMKNVEFGPRMRGIPKKERR